MREHPCFLVSRCRIVKVNKARYLQSHEHTRFGSKLRMLRMDMHMRHMHSHGSRALFSGPGPWFNHARTLSYSVCDPTLGIALNALNSQYAQRAQHSQHDRGQALSTSLFATKDCLLWDLQRMGLILT